MLNTLNSIKDLLAHEYRGIVQQFVLSLLEYFLEAKMPVQILIGTGFAK